MVYERYNLYMYKSACQMFIYFQTKNRLAVVADL